MTLTYIIPNLKARLLKNRLLNQNRTFILTDPSQLTKSLNFQKISIQWTPQNTVEMQSLLDIIQFLNKYEKKVDVQEKEKIFDDDLLLELAKQNYDFEIIMNYMLNSFLSGPNVTLNYSIQEYQEVIKKVKYFNQKVQEHTITEEDKIFFVISQLSRYIEYPDIENKTEEYMKYISDFYAAIMRGQAVCIGYSMALWKILNELGVPCKIMIGKDVEHKSKIEYETFLDSTEAHHAWNQVYLNGTWYNVDVTTFTQKNDPTYLLRSDDDFHELVPNPNYQAHACHQNYDQNRVIKQLENMSHHPNYLKQYDAEYTQINQRNR